MHRKKIIAVIGPSQPKCTPEILKFAYDLGQALIDAGYRVLTGGYDGIMSDTLKGAKSSKKFKEGDTVAVIMSKNKQDANEFADIVIVTGINNARNQIITLTADAVVAIAGGAGTLTELAFAWKFGKIIIAVTGLGGWSEKLANQQIDADRTDKILEAKTVQDCITLLSKNI